MSMASTHLHKVCYLSTQFGCFPTPIQKHPVCRYKNGTSLL